MRIRSLVFAVALVLSAQGVFSTSCNADTIRITYPANSAGIFVEAANIVVVGYVDYLSYYTASTSFVVVELYDPAGIVVETQRPSMDWGYTWMQFSSELSAVWERPTGGDKSSMVTNAIGAIAYDSSGNVISRNFVKIYVIESN